MRNIVLLSMVTLDGVVQAPGGTEEDRSEGFNYGGWAAPFGDDTSARMMKRLLEPADLLLGRKTFDISEDYWPGHADYWPGIKEVTKYVVSRTRKHSAWKNSVFLGSLEEVRQLKSAEGPDIKVWGSSVLAQLLLKNDLVDECWLMIHPLTLGQGKKLFADGVGAAAFTLSEATITSDGVIFANYKRAGAVKTGTVGA